MPLHGLYGVARVEERLPLPARRVAAFCGYPGAGVLSYLPFTHFSPTFKDWVHLVLKLLF